jgi:hypothetical protein
MIAKKWAPASWQPVFAMDRFRRSFMVQYVSFTSISSSLLLLMLTDLPYLFAFKAPAPAGNSVPLF